MLNRRFAAWEISGSSVACILLLGALDLLSAGWFC